MHLLAVFAHPRRDSFTGAVLDRFLEGLASAGHAAEIADLHAEAFDPRFHAGDFAQFTGGHPGVSVPTALTINSASVEQDDHDFEALVQAARDQRIRVAYKRESK